MKLNCKCGYSIMNEHGTYSNKNGLKVYYFKCHKCGQHYSIIVEDDQEQVREGIVLPRSSE